MKSFLLFFCCGIAPFIVYAQGQGISPEINKKNHHFYFQSSSDGISLSSGYKQTGTYNELTYLRFSLFFNIFSINYDLNKCGLFGLIDLANVGYIVKTKDSTYKVRSYNISIPLGIKLGNVVEHGNYVMFGGGIDIPFNYQEKGYRSSRYNKQKFNEWFSDRSPTLLPFAYIGAQFKSGISVKIQYYPTNFVNGDYTIINNGISNKPYKDLTINISSLMLGYNIEYSKYNRKDIDADF